MTCYLCMKIILWLVVGTAIVVGILLLYSFRFSRIETPQYKVVKKINDIEIRVYPSLVLAQTKLKSNRYDGNEDNGFRTVASYIFGGNSKQQKIAMTAPVIMDMSDTGASMSFVMPGKYQMEDLPKPSTANVEIKKQESKVLAVIEFGGFASQEKINRYGDYLDKSLKEAKITTIGSRLFFGYNAPWDVVNRRNEVAIEVVYVTED